MAKALAKLRKPSGEIPRYYQLVLRVKYKDAVPTDISYVTHRELRTGKTSVAEK
jgi:hypothetical protein